MSIELDWAPMLTAPTGGDRVIVKERRWSDGPLVIARATTGAAQSLTWHDTKGQVVHPAAWSPGETRALREGRRSQCACGAIVDNPEEWPDGFRVLCAACVKRRLHGAAAARRER